MTAQAECASICPDPKDQTGENVEILFLNPGPLHPLVDSIKSAAENGISIIPTDGELIRSSQPLNSKAAPDWSYSSVDFKHKGYPGAKIMWYGLEEINRTITSMAFVLGHQGQTDIMELATMNQSGEPSNPIPYLRGIPCTDPEEVVRVTNRPQPTGEQMRSLAELSIVPEVPLLIKTMLREVGPRTDYNAFRIVTPEISGDGAPFLRLKKYDADVDIPPLRATG